MERTKVVHVFVHAENRAALDLLAQFGFTEEVRDFVFPGAEFGEGGGVLLRADLPPPE
jgi:hypothetical protein